MYRWWKIGRTSRQNVPGFQVTLRSCHIKDYVVMSPFWTFLHCSKLEGIGGVFLLELLSIAVGNSCV